MFEALKKLKKKATVMVATAIATATAAVPVLAEGGSTGGTASTAVTGAMQTVANDMIATGNSIVPIALTVVGISLVVIFGIRMFRKIAK